MTRIPIDDENVNDANEANPFVDDAPREEEGTGVGPGPSASADVSKLQQERDALFERLARTTADFKNAQKRLEADVEQRAQYANSALIKSLIPVIDNFERALAVDPGKVDAASILKGLQIVHDQLIKVLRDQKVEEIVPQPGEHFDPARHQALMQQDAPQYAEPSVTQLLQKGYALHGRTLRPTNINAPPAGTRSSSSSR